MSQASAGSTNGPSTGCLDTRTPRPFAIGNAAAQQLQLDIYGELADVMRRRAKAVFPLPERRAELRRVLLGHLEKMWRQPDEGIWEIRGEPQHFVYSKVMAWVAFDRPARKRGDEEKHLKRWRRVAARPSAAKSFAKASIRKRNCFVQAYGSKHLDASLLLLPIVGFVSANDPRMKIPSARSRKI